MAFKDTLSALMPTFFPAVKSAGLGGLPMPRGAGRSFWWGDSSGPLYPGGLSVGRSIDYAQAAGDVTQNSAVAACLNWICTNWADAPVKVGTLSGNKFEPVPNHPLEVLLDQPNEDFNGKWLMWALLSDYYAYGNAYAYIVAPDGGEPKEIQWLPAGCVSPVSDGAGRLLRYDYKPAQTSIAVDKTRIVHFRFGVSRTNPLLGVSPLGPAIIEIVADNACARYPANIMHHGGLPPGVFVLKPGAAGSNMAPLDPDTAKAIMLAFNEKQQADPGAFKLIPGPLDFLMLGWKPSEMALSDLREEPETRICAQFGIPPIVVGLRAGMIRSTFANMEQSTKNAWNNCLVPTQKYFASEWTRRLLPFYPGGAGERVQYDHSSVGALMDDQNEKRGQARDDYAAGLLTHGEARGEQGRDPIENSEQDGLKKQQLGLTQIAVPEINHE